MSRLLCLTELLRPTSHPLPTRCGWTAGTPAAAGTDLAYRDLGVTLARPAVSQWLRGGADAGAGRPGDGADARAARARDGADTGAPRPRDGADTGAARPRG